LDIKLFEMELVLLRNELRKPEMLKEEVEDGVNLIDNQVEIDYIQ